MSKADLPSVLRTAHEELHEEMVAATRLGGETGAAARPSYGSCSLTFFSRKNSASLLSRCCPASHAARSRQTWRAYCGGRSF